MELLQTTLARGLAVVSGAVASRPTLPVLSHIMMRGETDGLLLAATDLEVAVSCMAIAKLDGFEGLAIPGRLLSAYVNVLPKDVLEISMKDDLWMKTEKTKTKFKGIDIKEFPLLQTRDVGTEREPKSRRVEIQPYVLAKMLAQVGISIASDESRPVLAGAHFVFADDTLTVVGADGFRLSVSKVKGVKTSEAFRATVPGSALSLLAGLLKDEGEPVQIEATSSQIIFYLAGDKGANEGKVRDIRLVSQLIEGNFPNYAQIVPKNHSLEVVMNREDLLRAFKSSLVFARAETNLVTIVIGQDRLTVQTSSTEMGNSQIEIDAEVKGDGIEIAFNVRFLLDAIKVMDTAKVVFEASSSARSGVFYQEGKKADFLYVAMPMHIRQGE